MQKRGVDVVVHLKCGNKVIADVKAERKDTGNFFIETNVEQKDYRGWSLKQMDSAYIVYGFVDTCKVFFLPLALLRQVVRERREEWKAAGLMRTFTHGGPKTEGYIPKQTEVCELLNKKMGPVKVPESSWRLLLESNAPTKDSESTSNAPPTGKLKPLASLQTRRSLLQGMMDSSPSSEKP